MTRPTVPTPPSATAARSPAAPRADGESPAPIRSRDLFAGATEIRIDHDGVVYRLRRTALGKLILTK